MLSATPLSYGQALRQLRTPGFRLLETRHPRGMVVGVHEHEHACVNFVLEGCYCEDFGRTAGAFGPLSAHYKPAREPHANCFRDTAARCLLIYLESDELLAPRIELGRVAWTRAPSACRAAIAIWHELAAPDPFSSLSIDQLALEMYENMLAGPVQKRAGSARVRAATDTLHDSPLEPWTLSALARHVGLHPSHLARSFRARHACTVGGYLRRLRVNEIARALALGDQPISELSALQGFTDQSHCTRAFRRQFGTTPAAFRRAFRPG